VYSTDDAMVRFVTKRVRNRTRLNELCHRDRIAWRDGTHKTTLQSATILDKCNSWRSHMMRHNVLCCMQLGISEGGAE
jgi:predicted LPLAT superfamily acyltransferase